MWISYIYILKKAFDKVDLGLLLKKVKDLDISGHLGAWIGVFVMSRKQAVRVGSSISAWE